MSSFIGLIRRLYKVFNPPIVPKLSSATSPSASATSTKPLNFGILGAATIGPPALIFPARCHPDVVVYAVAARKLEKAQFYAKRWGIEKAYEGYQTLLDDPEVDVIYNALPNALHYEWTMKALRAGKHVLNEKPTADTAAEAKAMFELAEEKNLVLLDAYHYRFHPAIKRVKAIIDSREIGYIQNITVEMQLPKGFMGDDDIRYDYELGGGAMMDLGCYAMNCLRYLSSSDPTSVLSTVHTVFTPRSPPADYISKVDRRMEATLALPNDVTATLRCDLAVPPTYGFIPKFPQISAKVEGALGSVEIFNFVLPTLYHSIGVKIKGGYSRDEKAYIYKDVEGNKGLGEEWWTTYRFQLEAFVEKVREREPETWLDKEDSIVNMEWVEKVYEKSGLGVRPCRI